MSTPRPPRYRYGSLGSDCPAKLELECIKRGGRWKDASGKDQGLGLAAHVKKFISLAWPDFEWHRWSHMMVERICTLRPTTIYGPASSGKSGAASCCALSLYWAHPEEFTALCSTTDLKRLELRVFAEIKMRFKQARERFPWLPGNIIESKQCIVTDDKGKEGRDFRNGIIGIACKKGSGEWQGLADYSGIKNTYVMLIADEVHMMEPGFLQGSANLKSNNNGNGWFVEIYLGNLVDLETPLGEAAEPECGWDAFPDSDVSRIYPTKFYQGAAIQLVGRDSPNLDFEPGKEPFKYLIGRRFMEQLKHDYGEGSPLYIAQAGGTIPRSSLANRVITKEICRKFNAFEPVVWGHEKITRIYAMDVSYTVSHGDRTVGAPLGFGRDIEGKLRLAYLEKPEVYKFPNLQGMTIEEAIAHKAKRECDRLGIPYAHIFYDGTGRSSFTAAAMRIIGTMVQPVEFGGKPSERQNFMNRRYRDSTKQGELLTCREVFDRFVTELWFAVRYLIEADQMRDLPEDTAKEGYMRAWELVAGNKIAVETKEEMKKRLNRSPDLFDMLVVGVEGARRLGFVIGEGEKKNPRGAPWLKELKSAYRKKLGEAELSYSN